MVVEKGQLDGEFEGFEDEKKVFAFFNTGNRWRQRGYRYHYHYAYMPRAQVVQRGGRYWIEVSGMSVSVEVERA